MAVHLLAAAASTSGPSWFWYATRGLGVATLIVLTATVVLGVVTDLFGADAALGGTAACLVLVALLFARLAPESYRARL